MHKLWAFTKRNAARLSHEAYRAGHVGHHASMLRRLRGLRGYCVDLRVDGQPGDGLGPLQREISFGEPADFHTLWDGLSTLYFDSAERAAQAAVREPTRATADGLSVDADWPGNDGPDLFESDTDGAGIPFHWAMEEHLLLPVERPERKQTKLLQFFRRNPAQSETAFRAAMLDRYARLTARMAGLEGYVVNFRRHDEAPADLGFTSGAAAPSNNGFSALWDGVCELHVASLEAFAAARADLALHPELCNLERHLFEAVWYADVDENVIVMPNRNSAPDFYYR